MLGGFYCPKCLKCSACSCDTCSKHLKEDDVLVSFTEDEELIICGYCGAVFHPDESLDTEFKIIQNETIKTENNSN